MADAVVSATKSAPTTLAGRSALPGPHDAGHSVTISALKDRPRPLGGGEPIPQAVAPVPPARGRRPPEVAGLELRGPIARGSVQPTASRARRWIASSAPTGHGRLSWIARS